MITGGGSISITGYNLVDTKANLTSSNPTLASGRFGIESDTKRAKLGDGLTAWNSLVYYGEEMIIRGGV